MLNILIEIIYSFQNDKKLNKITVIIDGFASGNIILTIVLKYPAPSIYAASSKSCGKDAKYDDNK